MKSINAFRLVYMNRWWYCCSSSSKQFSNVLDQCLSLHPILRVLGGQGASLREKQIILGPLELLKWRENGLKHIISVMLTNTLYYRVFRIFQGHISVIWGFLPSEEQFRPKTRQNLDLSLCEILDFAWSLPHLNIIYIIYITYILHWNTHNPMV